jgi:hypothetical protein
MKAYSDTETRKWSWLKRQTYIPSSDVEKYLLRYGYTLVEKFPIEKIKHNKKIYPNPLLMGCVIEMIDEFYPFGFHPIWIDKKFNLKDGQHRLKFAELCGLKFIDVLVGE